MRDDKSFIPIKSAEKKRLKTIKHVTPNKRYGNFTKHKEREGILILNSQGIIQQATIAACNLMGFDKDIIIGTPIDMFFCEISSFIYGKKNKSKPDFHCFEKHLFNHKQKSVSAKISVHCLDNSGMIVVIKDDSQLNKTYE